MMRLLGLSVFLVILSKVAMGGESNLNIPFELPVQSDQWKSVYDFLEVPEENERGEFKSARDGIIVAFTSKKEGKDFECIKSKLFRKRDGKRIVFEYQCYKNKQLQLVLSKDGSVELRNQ